jgi:hypothetical protein
MSQTTCDACFGTGEMPTDHGCVDCPDCGGAGYLPSKNVLVEWRSRDIERAVGSGLNLAPADVRFLLSELQTARTALTKVVALAHDVPETDGIASKIRAVAEHALGVKRERA